MKLRKKRIDYEMLEQEAVVRYIELMHPLCLFTASAGGMRTGMGAAIKMKRMGYKRGTPDIFIEEPRGKFHGLRIEMKTASTPWTEKGVASMEQKEWILQLSVRGYRAVFCYGRDEAIEEINSYLKL